MWAFIVIYLMIGINLLWVAHKHGHPREEDYNFWVTLISSIITLVTYWWVAGWRFI